MNCSINIIFFGKKRVLKILSKETKYVINKGEIDMETGILEIKFKENIIHWHGHCNHCGKDNRIIISLGLLGFANYCSDCTQTRIYTDAKQLGDAIHVLSEILKEKKII